MLTRYISRQKILLVVAIFILLIISIISIKTIVVKGQGSLIPTVLPKDAESPFKINDDYTSTPEAPDATQMAEYSKTVYPTPTKIPISKYIDLSPNLKDQDKFIIEVKHADGTYDQFTVGPLRPETPFFFTKLPDYILKEIPLQPGDDIISWLPPANPYRAMGTEPPTATQSIMINPTEITPTSIPYP